MAQEEIVMTVKAEVSPAKSDKCSNRRLNKRRKNIN